MVLCTACSVVLQHQRLQLCQTVLMTFAACSSFDAGEFGVAVREKVSGGCFLLLVGRIGVLQHAQEERHWVGAIHLHLVEHCSVSKRHLVERATLTAAP